MRLPEYNSNRTYEQLIADIKKIAYNHEEDNLDGLERHIVNFALECLNLNLKGASYSSENRDANRQAIHYEALYDYVKYNDPTAETSKFKEFNHEQ